MGCEGKKYKIPFSQARIDGNEYEIQIINTR